jgi:hypothetical protein
MFCKIIAIQQLWATIWIEDITTNQWVEMRGE